MKFDNYKAILKEIGIFTPIFFVANYFLLSLIVNLFLGANPKQSFLPIFLLIITFLISLFYSNRIPENISQKKILLLVDLILLVNVIILITGKVNAEGQLLKIFKEKAGTNLKLLLIIFVSLLLILRIYYRKINFSFSNTIFTVAFFLFPLLLIPVLYPAPFIDVYIILKQGIIDLSQNTDPYLRTFPDIYNGMYDYTYQKQEIKLVYWPLNLYLLYPFQMIFGDLRYAYLFFLMISCLILYFLINRNKVVFYISFILLFTNPYTFYMIKYAWIDTLAFPFFVLYFLFFKKKKFLFAYLILGILMSLKLYFIFLLPISILYLYNETKTWKRPILLGFISIFISALCFLPYLVTNYEALFYSIIYFKNSLPRLDSLSITGYLYQFDLNLNVLNSLISILIIIFILFRIWKKKRSSVLFQIQDLSILLFSLFIFGKQAFGNYYYNLMFLAIIYLSILAAEEKPTDKKALLKTNLNEN
ncbi:hypothetical protein IV494_13890 [Kaistella sp. G5-32]|uniref:DUF2029 domain-containing protein n=1 Tax=Kaistella gelatinilytica TaxID=2787636 RepID=A0ABS0FEX9_9FLAO|nr:hypothetical protein [Kaistella gelatinilytica]MBF8458271.1 hypothetical protein [Kaistella gelatinilytica]